MRFEWDDSHSNYEHMMVAGFVGHMMMNFVDHKVKVWQRKN